jgi:hypothetical protein
MTLLSRSQEPWGLQSEQMFGMIKAECIGHSAQLPVLSERSTPMSYGTSLGGSLLAKGEAPVT